MTSRSRRAFALATALILVLVRVIGTFLPSGRIWGINLLAHLPSWFVALFSVGVVLGILSFIHYGNYNRSIKSKKVPRGSKGNYRLITGLIAILAALTLFYLFSDSVNLLGDSPLRIQGIQEKGLDRLFVDSVSEPLDYLIHYFSYGHIFKPLGLDALACFRFWSYAAGLLFLWAAWRFSAKMANGDKGRGFVFASLLSWGGVMMFFGYAEDYALAAAFCMLFADLAVAYIRTGRGALRMSFCFVGAFCLHNLSVIFLPSLVYLFFSKTSTKTNRGRPAIVVAIILTLSYSVFAQLGKPDYGMLLFGSESEASYGLFSLAHFTDIANLLMLVCPVFPILAWFVRSRADYNRIDRQSSAFFILAAISGLAVLFLVDPKLGMARDWDLFALALLGFHLALLPMISWSEIDNLVKSTASSLGLCLSCTWIILNSNEGGALSRYWAFAGLDLTRAGYNYEVLGDHYYFKDDLPQAERAFTLSVKGRQHPRSYLWLGYVQLLQGKDAQAEINIKEALRLKPGDEYALNYLASLAQRQGRYRESKKYLQMYMTTPGGKRDRRVESSIRYLDSLINLQGAK